MIGVRAFHSHTEVAAGEVEIDFAGEEISLEARAFDHESDRGRRLSAVGDKEYRD